MPKKFKDTRKVTFEKDFSKASGRVLYAKDEVAYIHKDVVAKISKSKSFKAKVEELDLEGEVVKAKAQEAAQRKLDKEAASL
jgi:hypothetical protein